MSHTVSRGYHTARRWVSPALAVKEGLEQNEVPPHGALAAMERFFIWMLAGIEQEESTKSESSVRPLAARSALHISEMVFSSVYKIDVPRQRILVRGKAYISLLKKIRRTNRIPEAGVGKSEVQKLQIFLRELIKIGQQ